MSIVTNIYGDLFEEKREEILEIVKKASFISFDTEFSGLNYRKDYHDVMSDTVRLDVYYCKHRIAYSLCSWKPDMQKRNYRMFYKRIV